MSTGSFAWHRGCVERTEWQVSVGSDSVPGDAVFAVRLPPRPDSVSLARRHVHDLLERGGRLDLDDTATLLVSELVTNALLHAGTDIDLAGRLDRTGVRVEVGDGSVHLPSPRRYAATAGTGRGLLMLESVVDDWGVSRHPEGKTVWFHLSGAERERDASVVRRTDQADPGGDRACVPVQLQNMPLLLHAAWQEHAEALLREYLLASLDSGGEDPIQMHAEATDAIAVLEEHVPRSRGVLETDELMGGAAEPHVSAARLEVPVPVGSVPHFATLDRAIEAALDLSREGLVLTPPTQPEIQAFRRWLCRQVLGQADGSTPEPWTVPDDAGPEPQEATEWDPRTVTEASHGLIAANEASQILAASREATRLLGYDDPAELVGQRIVSIVPERYRQAHVAGFTMYLLVGRKPLLGQPVVVPGLCRDGSEVELELLVRDHGVGEGRSVLLAEIRLAPG